MGFFSSLMQVEGVLFPVIPVQESEAFFPPETFNWNKINGVPATDVGESTTASSVINVQKEKK